MFSEKVDAKLVSHIDATEHKESSCPRKEMNFFFSLLQVTIVKHDAELEKLAEELGIFYAQHKSSIKL